MSSQDELSAHLSDSYVSLWRLVRRGSTIDRASVKNQATILATQSRRPWPKAERARLKNIDDLREAVTMLEEIYGTARRVLGGAHPTTAVIDNYLRAARFVLRREALTPLRA